MKYNFFSNALIATVLTVTSIAPAFAEGGNDPIPGVDIIISKDPSLVPIQPFSVSDSSMKQLNSLKGDDRAGYLMKVIAERIKGDDGFVRNGTAALREKICSKCEIGKSIHVKFRSGKTTYTLDIKLDEL